MWSRSVNGLKYRASCALGGGSHEKSPPVRAGSSMFLRPTSRAEVTWSSFNAGASPSVAPNGYFFWGV